MKPLFWRKGGESNPCRTSLPSSAFQAAPFDLSGTFPKKCFSAWHRARQSSGLPARALPALAQASPALAYVQPTPTPKCWLRDAELNCVKAAYETAGLTGSLYPPKSLKPNRGPDANPAFRFWTARWYFRTEKVLRPLTATAGQFALPGHTVLSCTSPVHSPLTSTRAAAQVKPSKHFDLEAHPSIRFAVPTASASL